VNIRIKVNATSHQPYLKHNAEIIMSGRHKLKTAS